MPPEPTVTPPAAAPTVTPAPVAPPAAPVVEGAPAAPAAPVTPKPGEASFSKRVAQTIAKEKEIVAREQKVKENEGKIAAALEFESLKKLAATDARAFFAKLGITEAEARKIFPAPGAAAVQPNEQEKLLARIAELEKAQKDEREARTAEGQRIEKERAAAQEKADHAAFAAAAIDLAKGEAFRAIEAWENKEELAELLVSTGIRLLENKNPARGKDLAKLAADHVEKYLRDFAESGAKLKEKLAPPAAPKTEEPAPAVVEEKPPERTKFQQMQDKMKQAAAEVTADVRKSLTPKTAAGANGAVKPPVDDGKPLSPADAKRLVTEQLRAAGNAKRGGAA